MKKLLSFLVVLSCVLGIKAADTVFIKNPQIPILIERHDNVLCYMRIHAHEAKVLDNVSVTFGQDVPLLVVTRPGIRKAAAPSSPA